MITIKFLEAQEVKDGEGVIIKSFRKGQVVELNNASARFWLTRSLAVDVQAEARVKREAGETKAAEAKAAPAKVGKVNPTSPKSGKAKRPYVRRQARA